MAICRLDEQCGLDLSVIVDVDTSVYEGDRVPWCFVIKFDGFIA